MDSIDLMNKFLNIQFQIWASNKEKKKKENLRPGPVIAISREPGSNGEFITKTIANEFGLVLFDWKIVEEIAKDAHVSEQVVATLDEKFQSSLEDWLAGFSAGPVFSSFEYLQCLRKVLFTVATHGNAVILGRGANFLLPPEMRTLGLCFIAPLEARVRNIMQELRLSQENAAKHITQKEHEQRLWVKKHGFGDIHDPTHYHMVINTALVTPGAIVQIVKEIIGAKCVQTTE